VQRNLRDRAEDTLASHPPDDPACEYPGPILVLAGPGTGKTRSLAKRIKFLIESEQIKADPEEISAITFTRGAGAELCQRLSNDAEQETYVAPERQPSWIRTMHSLGNEVIDRCRQKVGLRKGFRLVASGTATQIIAADAASLLGLQRALAKQVLHCRQLGDCQPIRSDKCDVCSEYKRLLRGQNAIDYDDQIYLAVEALRNPGCNDVRADLQKHATYLLVDEYQDINTAQYNLIRLLSHGQEEGLFAVGDDDQSIYSFRGGSPKLILSFQTDFGEHAKVRELNECHRCPPSILNGALSLIAKNSSHRRRKPNLGSIVKKDKKILVSNSPSAVRQARSIAAQAKKLSQSHEVMVLTPSMKRAALVKNELRKQRVAYECNVDVEKTGLFLLDRMKDWLQDTENDLALRLCIEKILQNRDLPIPLEKEGNKELLLANVSQLWQAAAERKTSLYAALREASHKSECLADVLKLLESVKRSAHPHDYLANATRALRPWASTKGLFPEIAEWVHDARARSLTGGNPVRILTIQKAKGLTTDYVFVIGLEQGTFPKIGEGAEKEREQRRMMYVAMTRARRALYLSHARSGPRDICPYALKTADSANDHRGGFLPSQFLDEIDKAFTEERGWRHPLPKDHHMA